MVLYEYRLALLEENPSEMEKFDLARKLFYLLYIVCSPRSATEVLAARILSAIA